MARLGRLGFLGIAVLFHLIYIYSILDIYFVSPIVSGMKAYRVESEQAPAKRLVLFVGTHVVTHCPEALSDLITQETDFAQTRHSNPFLTLRLAPIIPPKRKYLDHLRLSYDLESSSMAHSESHILEFLPSPDPAMSHSLQVSTRMFPRSLQVGS